MTTEKNEMMEKVLRKAMSESYDEGALSIITIIKQAGIKGIAWEEVMKQLLDLEKSITKHIKESRDD
jgi:DUF1009 family protein